MIKNPVAAHLPTGCMKMKTTFKADVVEDLKTLAPKDEPIVFVIGAMAHGSVSVLHSCNRYTCSLGYKEGIHYVLSDMSGTPFHS